MDQPVALEGEGRAQSKHDAVAAAIALLPPLELLVSADVLVVKPQVDPVQRKQHPHSHRAAYEPQKGSFVVVGPIDQFEHQQQAPAQQLHPRYHTAQHRLKMHLFVETLQYRPNYQQRHRRYRKGKEHNFSTFAELLIVNGWRDASQKIVAGDQIRRASRIAAIVIKIDAGIADAAEQSGQVA